MKYYLWPFVIFSLLLFGCREPVEKENPYRQEALPWPSLADSPWPIYKQNPQNTGTNYLSLPITGNVLDTISLPVYEESNANVLIDSAGNFYITTFMDKSLDKYSNSGQLLWSVEFSTVTSSTPLLMHDGNIIAATDELKSIDPNGTINWTVNLPGIVIGGLNIDLDGNILCTDESGALTSISPDGTINWQQTETNNYNINFGPVIGPNGNQVYTTGEKLTAYNVSTGDTLWTFDNAQESSSLVSSPAIDNDGNIYFTSYFSEHSIAYCVAEDGSLNWSEQVVSSNKRKSTSPIITVDNKLIFSVGSTLYGFTLAGEQEFEVAMNNPAWGSACADNEGNVYFASTTNTDPVIMSYTSDGELRFNLSLPHEVDSGLSLFQSKLVFISYDQTGVSLLCVVE